MAKLRRQLHLFNRKKAESVFCQTEVSKLAVHLTNYMDQSGASAPPAQLVVDANQTRSWWIGDAPGRASPRPLLSGRGAR
jgi:hypothetical protein